MDALLVAQRMARAVRRLGKVPPLKKAQHAFQRWTQPAITETSLVKALRSIGVDQGDTLMVHASLSGLGHVDGGVQAVVGALLQVVGDEGTVLMPCHTGPPEDGVTLVDLRSCPVQTGAIARAFSLHPRTQRSLHPTHSVGGLGPRATDILGGHHLSVAPFDKASAYGRLIDAGARILTLGLDNRWITFYHHFEDVTEDFPIEVYEQGYRRAFVVGYEGGDPVSVLYRVHRQSVALARLNNVDARLRLVESRLRHWGASIAQQRIGRTTATLIFASDVFWVLDRMLREEGETIYCPHTLQRSAPDSILRPELLS